MFINVKMWLKNLLVRSQKLTGTDNIYIARGGFWTTIQFTATTIISLVTVIAFANLLPRDTYGTYRYLLSLASTFGFLTLTGSNIAVLRAAARGQANVLPHSIRLQLKFNLLAITATSALAGYYALHGNFIFALALSFLAISGPLSLVFNTYGAVLSGEKRFGTLAILTIASALVAAFATITTLFLTDSIIILIGVYSAATLVSMFAAYRYVVSTISSTPASPEAIAEQRTTGLHITAAGFFGTIAQYLDKIILFQAAGPAAVAVYGFATAGPDKLKGLAKGFIGIALPKLAQREIIDVRRVFYKRLGQSILIGTVLAGTYMISAPLLFRIFLPQYLDAIPYSQAYAALLVLMPATSFIGSAFLGLNMMRSVYMTNVGAPIIRIMLFGFLGWRWHTWGLIIASFSSVALSLIFYIIIWEIESRRISSFRS